MNVDFKEILFDANIIHDTSYDIHNDLYCTIVSVKLNLKSVIIIIIKRI